MNNFLKKPYPFIYEEPKNRIKVAIFVFLFVFFFLSVFQPFHLENSIDLNLYLCTGIYGLTAALVSLISLTIMIAVFPHFANERTWNIGRELIMMFAVLLSISIANFFVGILIELHPDNISIWKHLGDDFAHTFLVGIFPVMVITFTNYTVMLKRSMDGAEKHNFTREDHEPEVIIEAPVMVNITSPTNNNDIELNIEDLLYIMSDGNYVEFHYLEKGKEVREIRRNTMNNISKQLKNYPFIFRTHRAYMVNLGKISESSGNAQGYQLRLKGSETLIPVSRGNLAAFDEIVNTNSNWVEQYSM